jgi:2C-methyl-D-erythritol 2,4-cyclodiphosphate synthase
MESTDIEITPQMEKEMRKKEQQELLNKRMENPRALRGGRGAHKSSGVVEVRKPAKLKNDREQMYMNIAKDLRKRMKRISDAQSRGEEIIAS